MAPTVGLHTKPANPPVHDFFVIVVFSTVLADFNYVFSENGLVAYKNGTLVAKQSLSSFLGEDQLKHFINFVLAYLAGV